jgi:hypothetical protein
MAPPERGTDCAVAAVPTKAMAFHIRKSVDGQAIWLTAIFPAVTWGPQEQALAFRTTGHARQALARLPQNASHGAEIIDGDAA